MRSSPMPFLLFATVGLAACSSCGGSVESDDEVADGGQEPACTTPLRGERAFGVTFAGSVSMELASGDDGEAPTVERPLSLDLYFPEGRNPRADVVLAWNTLSTGGGSMSSTPDSTTKPTTQCGRPSGLILGRARNYMANSKGLSSR